MSRKVDHEQRKREIAAKAMRLFSQSGYDNVSLIMIAAASGVSRTAIYRYFCSKREVMIASIQQVTDEIRDRTVKVLATREPAHEKLIALCHAVAEVMFEHREFVIAVFDFVVGMVRTGADVNKAISLYTSGTRSAIKALIAHGKRAGEFPEVLIEERTADALYAEFESCAMRIVLNTESNADAAKVRFSDVIHAITLWK